MCAPGGAIAAAALPMPEAVEARPVDRNNTVWTRREEPKFKPVSRHCAGCGAPRAGEPICSYCGLVA